MILVQRDLQATARSSEAHDVLHRESTLARVVRTTNRPMRNNPLLLGEPGVGKTALIEGLAFRLAHKNQRPQQLQQLLELNTSKLAMLLADHDTATLDKAQQELLALSQALILLDDARLLFTQSDLTALLYFLQPLLTKPDVFVCLACGMAEYRRYIERDPILSRELERIQIDELSEEQAGDVALQMAPLRMRKTGLRIEADTVRQSVTLAKRYIPERALPDKALSLLHEAFAKVQSEGKEKVELKDCKQIIAEKTGIPVDTLSASDQEKLLHLEKELDKQVVGQPHITQAVAKVIRRARAGLKDPGRPTASFLFLGSSGVGKTELAKVLAKTVYHNERALLRFDMSEFSEPHNVQRLVGAPPGYIGFEDGGQLTNAVLSQPYSLILLDEIEKAHPKVFDIFLQVMDDGRLTDGKGRTVDFSNCTIIATSNLAVEEILLAFKQGKNVTERQWYEQRVLPLLGNYFRPEFINRFDEVLVFSPFSKKYLFEIAKLEVKKLEKRLSDLHVDLHVDEENLRAIVDELYNPIFGARPIRRYLQESIENDVATQLLKSKI